MNACPYVDISKLSGIQFECRECGAGRTLPVSQLLDPPQKWLHTAMDLCKHHSAESELLRPDGQDDWKKVSRLCQLLAEVRDLVSTEDHTITMKFVFAPDD